MTIWMFLLLAMVFAVGFLCGSIAEGGLTIEQRKPPGVKR